LKRKILTMLLALIVLFSVFTGNVLASSLFEYYNENDDNDIECWEADYWVGQSFTMNTTANVTSVKLFLHRGEGTGEKLPGIFYVNIKALIAGESKGAILATGNSSADTLPDGSPYEWREISLGSGCVLEEGESYGITLNAPDSSIASSLSWRSDFTSSEYTGGVYGYSTDGGADWSMGIYDMMFELWGEGIVSPSCTTGSALNIDYNEYMEWFEVDLYGNVASDGGENVTAGFYYKVSTDDDWSWTNCLGEYSTSDNFTTELIGLEVGKIYHYKAYVENSINYGVGSTENFTCTLPESVPDIQTLMYPIEYFTDNVTIYGYVLYDGSANVTGDFQYKISDNATWNWSTSNMTDLVTGNQFYYNIPNVVESVQYDFRAVGTNIHGITYGGIGHFILHISVAPTMETLPVGVITSTTAWVTGNVTDDGGEPVFANFYWRRLGVADWNKTSYTLLETGEDYSYKLTGLNPSTTYQYKAYGWHGIGSARTESYGDIHTFYTYDAVSIPVMSTGDWTYLNYSYASMNATVDHDGGSPVAVSLQYRLLGDSIWIETVPTPGVITGYEVSHMTYELEYGLYYEYRAKGDNEQGIGYGIIKTSLQIAPDDDTTIIITPDDYFGDIIDDIRNRLGLTGAMGTWAFMALILLLVAVVFASAMFSQKDNETAKTVIGVIWALFSMTVVGAFIFTGELGIWPIVILVGVVVFAVITFMGIKLSGGRA